MVSNRLYLTPFPIPSQQTQLAPSITTATKHFTTPFFAVNLSSHLTCLNMANPLYHSTFATARDHQQAPPLGYPKLSCGRSQWPRSLSSFCLLFDVSKVKLQCSN